MKIRTEGIVIKSIPFAENSKIVTLITPGEGIIKLFVRGCSVIKNAMLSPFTQIHCSYFFKEEGLSSFCEGEIIQQNLALRNSLEGLETAYSLNQMILQTQLPGKKSPKLYALLQFFLKKIPQIPSPELLIPIFCIKMLLHEGYLQLEKKCSSCQHALTATYRHQGDCFCKQHALPQAVLFPQEEEEMLKIFALGRSLEKMLSLAPTKTFCKKILSLFQQNYL